MKQLNNNRSLKSKLCSSMMLFASLFAAESKAQIFVPALNSQTMYPTTGTTALNLDVANTKYLSNFSFPGSGPFSGSTIEVAGWSTSTDGGFSYGLAMTAPPYTYTGKGAMAIPNAIDVQVGYMEQGANQYIIAAYYDVNLRNYAYDLYSFAFAPPSSINVTKLYTYILRNPDHSLGFVPTITTAGPPPSVPTYYPAPDTLGSMAYNRISMDINRDGDKVAIVLTDANTNYMYLATGQLGADTILFSPNLPTSGPAYILGPTGGFSYVEGPFTCSFGAPWVYDAVGNHWDYYDGYTGFYVRHIVATGRYLYSYFPIDRGFCIYETDAINIGLVIGLSSSWGSPYYSPLIGIKAISYVTTPGFNAYFNQIWPDVCFNGDDIRMVCYINNPLGGDDGYGNENGAEDLYVSDYGWTFNDFYYATGPSVWGTPYTSYILAGPTHKEVAFRNSFDGRPLRESPSTLFSFDFESQCKSLPLVVGEDIRAKIDGPDNGGNTVAITFAYSGVPVSGYSARYFDGSGPLLVDPVHFSIEFGKKNIYVRHYGVQDILTNGSMTSAFSSINTSNNINPVIAFSPFSIHKFRVAWASEDAAAGTGHQWSYIGMEIDKSSGPGTLASATDYLRLPNTPTLTNPSGSTPLVALSRHDNGLSNLYTCFTQEDATPLYSVQHKEHNWGSLSTTWRTTQAAATAGNELSVGPNPFMSTFKVNASEGLTIKLTDVTGKNLLQSRGTATDVNKQLETTTPGLSSGTYLLETTTESGKKEMFKMTKQ